MAYQKLGEVLLEQNLLPPETLSEFLQAAGQDGDASFPMLSNRTYLHYLSKNQIKKLMGMFCQTKVIGPDEMKWDFDALNLVPDSFAKRHKFIPVGFASNETEMVVATKKPLSGQAVDHLHQTTLKEIRQLLLTPDDFSDLYQKAFPGSQPMNLIQADIGDDESRAVETVDQIIMQSLDKRASDIHIEPSYEESRIRIRIDGILHTIGELSKDITFPVISRIKILANLDITNHFTPQEGSFLFLHSELDTPPVNIRVSILPGALGEKTVLRLLPPEESLLPLNHLGMPEAVYDTFLQTLQSPNGVVLVTGPAASGKSTTLYSVLQHLRDDRTNICTIEDPIEMMMSGINQFQINPHHDFGYARILQSLLRQDPNIIMVGEIRDVETAEIALQAGLTGHLVFSTLHTNDSASAFTRLIEMGCDPFLVAASIRAVLSQRLVRLVCEQCKAQRAPRQEELDYYGIRREDIPQVAYGKGCERCHGTGFVDRTGLFEILPMDEELQNLIMVEKSPTAMTDMMRRKNLITLHQDGMRKLQKDITTLEEVATAVYLKRD